MVEMESTYFCSETDTLYPYFLKKAPSIEPVVAKDQQLPQIAWSLTGPTAPEEIVITRIQG